MWKISRKSCSMSATRNTFTGGSS